MSTHAMYCPRCTERSRGTHVVVPAVEPGGTCYACGWTWGSPTLCPDERIAVALESIAADLTALRCALIGDGRHEQKLSVGPFSHVHTVKPGAVPQAMAATATDS